MNFCARCGNQLNGENFCTKCGAKVISDVNTARNNQSEKKSKKSIFVKIILASFVLAMIIVVLYLFKGRSYETLVKEYVTATMDVDAKKIVSLMPASLVDYIAEEEYDGDKEDMIFDLEDHLDDMVDKIKDYGIDLSKISYEIVEVEDMEDDDIDDLEDEYRRTKLDIKEGKELEVELKIPVNGKEQTNSIYLDVVKIGRSWYLIDMY